MIVRNQDVDFLLRGVNGRVHRLTGTRPYLKPLDGASS
jgi:hypothetical protein